MTADKGVWRLEIDVPKEKADACAEALEPLVDAQAAFELPGGVLWKLEGYSETEPDRAAVAAALAGLGVATDGLRLELLPPTDWLRASYASFPPIRVGRFFVHGSHVDEPPPEDSLPLLIDAATAFGSGEHATTKGCLAALHDLRDERTIAGALDMGCGSGILAFAVAKAWGVPVLAVDIDEESVRVARENAEANGVAHLVTAEAGDGYAAPAVAAHGPYDLILSNILAGPLVQLAPDLARHLAPGGVAVLSGLLQEQEAQVLAAHVAQGLVHVRSYPIADWQTLVLRRPT